MDEVLIESDEDYADKVGALMTEAYHTASYECWQWHKKYSKWFSGSMQPNFMFDLAGGYKVGKDYYDVH